MDHQKIQLVESLQSFGHIKSPRIRKAMLKVPRELFVPDRYKDDSYSDIPLPIPGGQSISAPHMHAIVLSEMNLRAGHNVLEVGAGSGILLAYMREIIGKGGKVIGIEINKDTCRYGRKCLRNAGYSDVKLVCGDGSLGYLKHALYDRIIVSAAYPSIPSSLINQLRAGGIMIAVIGGFDSQTLVKIRKTKSGKLVHNQLMPVMFVPLKVAHGNKPSQSNI